MDPGSYDPGDPRVGVRREARDRLGELAAQDLAQGDVLEHLAQRPAHGDPDFAQVGGLALVDAASRVACPRTPAMGPLTTRRTSAIMIVSGSRASLKPPSGPRWDVTRPPRRRSDRIAPRNLAGRSWSWARCSALTERSLAASVSNARMAYSALAGICIGTHSAVVHGPREADAGASMVVGVPDLSAPPPLPVRRACARTWPRSCRDVLEGGVDVVQLREKDARRRRRARRGA